MADPPPAEQRAPGTARVSPIRWRGKRCLLCATRERRPAAKSALGAAGDLMHYLVCNQLTGNAATSRPTRPMSEPAVIDISTPTTA